MFVPTRPLFYVTVTFPVYHHSTDGYLGLSTRLDTAHLTLDEAYGQMVLNTQEAIADGDPEVYFGIQYKGKRMPTPSNVLAKQGPYYCPFNGERIFGGIESPHHHDCYPF